MKKLHVFTYWGNVSEEAHTFFSSRAFWKSWDPEVLDLHVVSLFFTLACDANYNSEKKGNTYM